MQNDMVRHAPETKAVDGSVGDAFAEFMGTFETFRETNDRRLAEIERRSADPVTEEKLARLDRALDSQKDRLDRLQLKAARPMLESGREEREGGGIAATEHKAAFDAYVRSGTEQGLRGLERKALNLDSDGGYLVPDEIEREIGRRLAALSPIRSIASVRTVSSATFKKPFSKAGPVSAWVADTAARTQTTAPVLAELVFPTAELYAMPAATPTLLEDAAVDVDAWLASEIDAAFAVQEGTAFVLGDGDGRPRGFLDYDQVLESAWAWEKIGTVETGEDGAFPAEAPADVLFDLIYTLKAGYRQNAHFVMNRSTQAAVRKLKDADDTYVWQPPTTPEAKAMLLGFPVVEAEDMPDIATDAAAIAFGDFRRGYLIVDRAGVRVLRDPYSAKPYVLFYTTKRVGGGVQDFDAIKLLKFSAPPTP